MKVLEINKSSSVFNFYYSSSKLAVQVAVKGEVPVL